MKIPRTHRAVGVPNRELLRRGLLLGTVVALAACSDLNKPPAGAVPRLSASTATQPGQPQISLTGTDASGANFHVTWTASIDQATGQPVGLYVLSYGFEDGSWQDSSQTQTNSANVHFPYASSTATDSAWLCVTPIDGSGSRGPHGCHGFNVPVRTSSQLVLNEDFSATTRADYESHGWYDGTANITTDPNADGYKFQTDATLGRNVMYAHWATTTSYPPGGDPKSPGSAWRFALDPSSTTGGATAYVLFKLLNVMESPFGGHWTRFGRAFGQWTPPNSDGQMDMDIAGANGQGDQNYDPATGQPINDWSRVNRTFHLYLGWNVSWANPNNGGFLHDSTWYEMAYYLTPGTGSCPGGSTCWGTTDGALRVVYRAWTPGGTNPWTTVMVGQNLATAYGSGNITQFLIGPYMDRWANDIRHYYATIRLYTGNAICDGTIDPALTC